MQETKKRLVCIISVIAVFMITAVFVLLKTGVFSFPGGKTVRAEDLMEGIYPSAVHVDGQITDYSGAVSDFSIRLFRESYNKCGVGENVLVSPVSVLLALSMTANGAQGETLTQMEDVLGMKTGELNDFAYLYSHILEDRPDYSGELDIANSIWFKDDPDFEVNKYFLQINADYYDASVYSSHFDASAVKTINNWVSKKTKGMIPAVIDEISNDALMFLVNALAFDAEWNNIYKEDQVRDDLFLTALNEQKKVSFLHNTENIYLEDGNAVGFMKYYKGKRYAFAALLPNEGIHPGDYLNNLDGDHLSEILKNAETCEVRTSMPKFKTEYSVEMSEILGNMGMARPFDMFLAEFYNMGICRDPNRNNLFIGSVLHKTYIAVDEKGTKAGAATVVRMDGGTSAPMEKPKPKEVYLTRPFIYMLIDVEANIPLFIGVMNDPGAK